MNVHGRAALWWTVAAAGMAVSWWSSSRPIAVPAALHFPGADKLIHATAWAVLAACHARALTAAVPAWSRAGRAALAMALAAAYGLADEWHQFFVPGRSADAWDLCADTVGALIGAAAASRGRGSRPPSP